MPEVIQISGGHLPGHDPPAELRVHLLGGGFLNPPSLGSVGHPRQGVGHQVPSTGAVCPKAVIWPHFHENVFFGMALRVHNIILPNIFNDHKGQL